MKLSEAIRLGSMLGPQSHGHLQRTRRKYFFGLIGPVITEYCALGAAFAASGAKGVDTFSADDHPGFRGGAIKKGQKVRTIEHEWPTLTWSVVACPGCEIAPPAHAVAPSMPLYRLIPHLNDDHEWTREQIADFVETIESQQAADAVGLSVVEPVASNAR